MSKKSKLSTPAWITEGYDSKADYEKAYRGSEKKKTGAKTFKIRECPKCGSDDVAIVVGQEKAGMWICNKCKWEGTDVKEKELTEDEFMKYLDEKGEDVA